MNFFQMIVLLKIFVSGKSFDRICLKAVRDTFYIQHMEFDQETGGLNFLVKSSDIQQKGKVQTC